jgi:hypothetical protein
MPGSGRVVLTHQARLGRARYGAGAQYGTYPGVAAEWVCRRAAGEALTTLQSIGTRKRC